MYDKLLKRLREDMPTALANCDFDFVEGWSKEAADAIEELQKRVPKTPHGRLIDADALEYEEAYLNGHYELGDDEIVTREDIESAPTIIPAEEGE